MGVEQKEGIKVKLYTGERDKQLVMEATIPPFNRPPDVLYWGTRVFVHDGAGPGRDEEKYNEAFAFAIVGQQSVA